jgi:hypothetical protein
VVAAVQTVVAEEVVLREPFVPAVVEVVELLVPFFVVEEVAVEQIAVAEEEEQVVSLAVAVVAVEQVDVLAVVEEEVVD